jgi:hypothetical protein
MLLCTFLAAIFHTSFILTYLPHNHLSSNISAHEKEKINSKKSAYNKGLPQSALRVFNITFTVLTSCPGVLGRSEPQHLFKEVIVCIAVYLK